MANPILKEDLISPQAEGALDNLIEKLEILVSKFTALGGAEDKQLQSMKQEANTVNGTA